ncbi:hypothetical protein [Cohnella panacarvi]|uniref:hypothetical protein n=1 Tax=Cohnella panacarvi TaxID=400776 RepID=UPI00047DEEC4|nr:hypothetical protein [Cohnella panacarvi]
MKTFDIEVADCPEHQFITLLESLLTRIRERVSEVLQQETSQRMLTKSLIEHPNLQVRSKLAFFLECFMHLHAGWSNLLKFLEWVKGLTADSMFDHMFEKTIQLVNAWQRFQLEYNRLLRKPELFSQEFATKFSAIIDREYKTYRLFLELLKREQYA